MILSGSDSVNQILRFAILVSIFFGVVAVPAPVMDFFDLFSKS